MSNITWIGSPNFDTNRTPIDRIVIHWFGVGTSIKGVDSQFQKAGGTSAHYAVENNIIHQYVREEHVAYHAGVYTMNQRSIGIEHSAEVDRPATDLTYETSAQLIAEICKRYRIALDRTHIIGHKEVPKATQCPGTINIDRLISLAQKHMADTITIDAKLYEKLVGNSTAKKEVAEYLKIANPDDAGSEEMKRVIGGIQSRVTDLQNQLNNTQTKLSNAEAEISRLREELTKSTNSQDSLLRQVKAQQEMLDKLGREAGELQTRITQLENENRELKKGNISDLPAHELLRLAVLKFLRLS